MRRALSAALVAGVVGASALAAPAGVPGAAASAATGAGASATASAASCTVTASSLTWGFKESFRSYISGSIAKGEWTEADGATYTIPSFGWADATGDVDGGSGTVQFTGSVRFTGHEGVLDTTIANPALRFDGSAKAVLLLDVKGETQEGVDIDEKAVPFADIALPDEAAVSAALEDGGTATITSAATTLRSEGATAFGSYEAGTVLDPITASVTVSCPMPTPTPTPTPTSTATAEAAGGAAASDADGGDTGAAPTGLAIGGIALAAIVVASAGYLYFRRRRAVPAPPTTDGDPE